MHTYPTKTIWPYFGTVIAIIAFVVQSPPEWWYDQSVELPNAAATQVHVAATYSEDGDRHTNLFRFQPSVHATQRRLPVEYQSRRRVELNLPTYAPQSEPTEIRAKYAASTIRAELDRRLAETETSPIAKFVIERRRVKRSIEPAGLPQMPDAQPKSKQYQPRDSFSTASVEGDETFDPHELANRLNITPIDVNQLESATAQTAPVVKNSLPQSIGPSFPTPAALIRDVTKLIADGQSGPTVDRWCSEVIASLNRWEALTNTADPQVPEIVDQLDRLSKVEPTRLSNDLQVASKLRRIGYSMQRRITVWRAIHILASNSKPQPEVRETDFAPMLVALHARLTQDEVLKDWSTYLRIPRLLEIATSPTGVEPTVRRETAREVLALMHARQLTPDQVSLLNRPTFRRFEQELRLWAYEPIDISEFLKGVEEFELTRSDSSSRYLLQNIQKLKWSNEVPAKQLGEAMELHYRNANVRLALTSELINQLLPVMRPIQEPVSDQILGASVSGRNSTWTRLQVQLTPDDHHLRLRLVADGQTRSQTVSSKGPVRVFSQGRALFNVGKEFRLGRRGLRTSRTEAKTSSHARTIDIETDYDQIPILGWIVRQIAIGELDDNRQQVREHMKDRVSTAAKSRLNDAVEDRMQTMQSSLKTAVMTPLKQLDLDLNAIETRTTNERVIVRCRLAGSHQLAAHTPRPQAVRNSLMSMQLHDSTVNNLLQQLQLGGQKIELEELIARLKTQLRVERQDIHEDIPEGVTVQLADGQPIQFEFDDSHVIVTVRISELSTRRRTWRDFVVRAIYQADASQLHVDLQREGGIQLISQKLGFRDQIALRGIFTKVMTRNHRMQILHGRFKEDSRLNRLEVVQFVAEEGWIGISLAVRDPDRVARENAKKRN